MPSDLPLLLTNARFVDVARGVYHPPGTSLRIEGDRIARLEAAGPEAGGRVIDLGDRAVLPAFFNTHCHIQMSVPAMLAAPYDAPMMWLLGKRQIDRNMEECLRRGVLHLRDAWSADLRQNRRLQRRIDAGELLGPKIHQCVVVGPTGGYLSERRGPVHRLGYAVMGMPYLPYDHRDAGVVAFSPAASLEEVERAVDRAVEERGADYIKIGDQREAIPSMAPDNVLMTRPQMRAIVERARHHGLETTLHQTSVESVRRALSCGVRSLAHTTLHGPLAAADIEEILRCGAVFEPSALAIYVFTLPVAGHWSQDDASMRALHAYREQTYRGWIREHWLPGLSHRAQQGMRALQRGARRALGLIDMGGVFRMSANNVRFGVRNLRRLKDAGVPLAVGSDAGMPPLTPAMVGPELQALDFLLRLAGGGLDGADAVRVLTRNSADAMGLEDELGSLAPGKRADLVVLDGDPLADFHRLGETAAAVFVGGELRFDNCGLAG